MGVTLRTALHPGDIGTIAAMHGILYAREHGFDVRFEAYVAEPLGQLVRRGISERERVWLAEDQDQVVGSVAIVMESAECAQLRWFLVAPEARGAGLGRRLLEEAISFSRSAGYPRIILWTVSALEGAARLYRAAGFDKTESMPSRQWGRDVVEEKYELIL